MANPTDVTYIYKLIPCSSPDLVPPPNVSELPERLPVSDLDRESGFIHLSTARQVPGTLRFFFADERRVYVLRLRYQDDGAVARLIRWEDPKAEVCGPRGGEGMFPHLYNGLKLGRDEVESNHVLERSADSGADWGDALRKAESWLVY